MRDNPAAALAYPCAHLRPVWQGAMVFIIVTRHNQSQVRQLQGHCHCQTCSCVDLRWASCPAAAVRTAAPAHTRKQASFSLQDPTSHDCKAARPPAGRSASASDNSRPWMVSPDHTASDPLAASCKAVRVALPPFHCRSTFSMSIELFTFGTGCPASPFTCVPSSST